MRYCGTVTDPVWYRAVFCQPIPSQYLLEKTPCQEEVDKAFDIIFGLNRQPRVYSDELKEL